MSETPDFSGPYDLYDGRPPAVAGDAASRDAADSITLSVAAMQRMVWKRMQEIGAPGTTIDALEAYFCQLHQSIGPRVRELVQKGLVANTGKRRGVRSGCTAFVWVCAEHWVPGKGAIKPGKSTIFSALKKPILKLLSQLVESGCQCHYFDVGEKCRGCTAKKLLKDLGIDTQ